MARVAILFITSILPRAPKLLAWQAGQGARHGGRLFLFRRLVMNCWCCKDENKKRSEENMDATCKLHNSTQNPLAWWMLSTSQSHKTSDTLWNSIPVVVWYNFWRPVWGVSEPSRRPTWLHAMRKMMEENERGINQIGSIWKQASKFLKGISEHWTTQNRMAYHHFSNGNCHLKCPQFLNPYDKPRDRYHKVNGQKTMMSSLDRPQWSFGSSN